MQLSQEAEVGCLATVRGLVEEVDGETVLTAASLVDVNCEEVSQGVALTVQTGDVAAECDSKAEALEGLLVRLERPANVTHRLGEDSVLIDDGKDSRSCKPQKARARQW